MRILILAGALTISGIAAWGGLTLLYEAPIQGFVMGMALLLASQVAVLSERNRGKPLGETQRIAQEAERGRRLAIYHPSSGLLAQWYFELRLDEETARAKRYGLPLVVLTLKGSFDGALRPVNSPSQSTNEASRAVYAAVRRTDLVGSIGFSELAICLVHCDRAGAAPVIRRMMASLEEDNWRLGIAVYPDDDLPSRDLIALADRRAAPWKAKPHRLDKVA